MWGFGRKKPKQQMPDPNQSPPNPSDEPSTSDAAGSAQPEPEKPKKKEKTQRDSLLEEIKERFLCGFRVLVSQNRRRIKVDGFDLDLTYITDRIIAMGYPANHTESIYRNNMKHIKRFFERRHQNHYKVFNLTLYQPHPIFRRGQYSYDPANFQNRVISFEMTDHHPPRLELMAPFCREVHEWLSEDPRNVVAVHCKAGKGRTGVMICAYLAYCLFYKYPRQNMDYYSIVRTRNNKGVTIPSQRRYIYYYEHLRRERLNYYPLRTQLVGIYIERPSKLRSSGLIRDSMSMRVANGDIDVYYGDAITLSEEEWNDEESAWRDGASAVGPDSYDPKKPDDESRNKISRRAYGWTVPADQPVYLEGDVRVDLYLHKKIINKIRATGKSKIGHVWLNTMFTCPGACGTPYVHGDEAHPYPDGETTIAHKKKEFRPEDDPCSPSTSHDDDEGNTSKTTSPTKEGDTTSPLSKSGKKKSRISKAGKAVTKFFSGSDSSPKSGINAPIESSKSRRSHPEKLNLSNTPCRPPIDPSQLEIPEPPGLDAHCSEESLQLIYRDADIAVPREAIRDMLQEAHDTHIVTDRYHERLNSLKRDGPPVPPGKDGKPFCSGPHFLIKGSEEHVQYFPVMEIDRAFKNETVSNDFKIIVVTRCLDAKTYRNAEAFMNVTHEKQKTVNLAVYDKSQRGKSYVDPDPKLAESGSGMTWPPVIQYGNSGMQGVGGESKTLSDEVYKNDPRAYDAKTCRYFYKQRRDSISRFPSSSHTCPLTGYCVEGSMRSERLNTNTTIRSERLNTNTTTRSAGVSGLVGERSVTPVESGSTPTSLSTTLVPMAEAEPELEMTAEEIEEEMAIVRGMEEEIRRYHPHAAAERADSSSESDDDDCDDEPMDETKAVVEEIVPGFFDKSRPSTSKDSE